MAYVGCGIPPDGYSSTITIRTASTKQDKKNCVKKNASYKDEVENLTLDIALN
jgi:hypothetical protein